MKRLTAEAEARNSKTDIKKILINIFSYVQLFHYFNQTSFMVKIITLALFFSAENIPVDINYLFSKFDESCKKIAIVRHYKP